MGSEHTALPSAASPHPVVQHLSCLQTGYHLQQTQQQKQQQQHDRCVVRSKPSASSCLTGRSLTCVPPRTAAAVVIHAHPEFLQGLDNNSLPVTFNIHAATLSRSPHPAGLFPHLYRPVGDFLCICQAHVCTAVADLPCAAQHHPLPAHAASSHAAATV